GPRKKFDQDLERFLLEAEGAEVEAAIARIENSDDDLLAAHGWKHRDAQFDTAEFGVGGRMTFLGQIALIRNEVGHDFEAAGAFVHQIERQMDQFIEHAVKPDTDGEG